MNGRTLVVLVLLCIGSVGLGADGPAGTLNGVLKSVAKDHIVIQGPGLVDRRIDLTPDTKIGLPMAGAVLDANTKTLRYSIMLISRQIGEPDSEIVQFPVAQGLWLRGVLGKAGDFEKALAKPPLTLTNYELTRTALAAHAPEANDLAIAGQLIAGDDGAWTLAVGDRRVTVRLGAQGRLAGLAVAELKPYQQDVFATGREANDAFVANELLVQPVGDPFSRGDANLPRVLTIGDSISIGYGPVVRLALLGKANVQRPPVNCGSSQMGRASVHRWLGVCNVPGRKWDVISFNAGHWDGGNAALTKETYQANLQAILDTLQKTGARLVWVTTTPVPYGYNVATAPNEAFAPVLPEKDWPSMEYENADANRWLPGRNRTLNSWAAELLSKHPEVLVCDQWQMVKDGEKGFYRTWWHTKNVHFRAGEPIPLGRALAKKILEALGRPGEALNPMSVYGQWADGVPESVTSQPAGK